MPQARCAATGNYRQALRDELQHAAKRAAASGIGGTGQGLPMGHGVVTRGRLAVVASPSAPGPPGPPGPPLETPPMHARRRRHRPQHKAGQPQLQTAGKGKVSMTEARACDN